MKKFLSVLLAVTLMLSLASCGLFGGKTNKTETPVSIESTEEAKQEEPLVLILHGDEQGEYSTKIYFNKGTEDEIGRYVQHIPTGTYTAKNIGNYTGAIYVYSDEVHKTDLGFEEPAENFFGKTVDVDDSVEFTIEEGQHIYIPKPGIFVLVKQ